MLLRRDRALTAVAIMLDIAFHAGRTGELVSGADVAERMGAAMALHMADFVSAINEGGF